VQQAAQGSIQWSLAFARQGVVVAELAAKGSPAGVFASVDVTQLTAAALQELPHSGAGPDGAQFLQQLPPPLELA